MTAIVPPALLDLAQRLRERAATLDRMADQHRDYVERARLWGKAGGVELALSFVLEAIREAESDYGHLDWPDYAVQARGNGGRFMADPIPHYNRGRTHIEPRVDGSPCTGDPCTCTNGIGCVNIPVDQW